MNRLTTDAPAGNFETILNFAYGKDGWVHIRHDGAEGDVPLAQWAKAQCILRGCVEFSAETPLEIDEEISDCMMDFPACPIAMDFPDCPIALAYCFASQAVHLRDRLKMYEDVLFAEDGTELLTPDDLQNAARPNDPLTLDQLLEMDGEPVFVTSALGEEPMWYIVDVEDNELKNPWERIDLGDWGSGWPYKAYRHPPKEATS